MRPRLPMRFVLILAGVLLAGALIAFAQGDDSAPLSGSVTYTVKRGDVLDIIAASFDVSVQCLIEINQLDSPNRIFPGDTIIISAECPFYEGYYPVLNPRPGSSNSAPTSASGQGGGGASSPSVQPGGETYVIKRGDTLDEIAKRYDVAVWALLEINGSPHPQDVLPGMTIVIPADTYPYGFPKPPAVLGDQGGGVNAGPGDDLYVVQPFDTLDKIGSMYNKQAKCIAETNALENPNRIYPGQVLVIAGSCTIYDGLLPLSTPGPGAAMQRGAGSRPPVTVTQEAQATPEEGGLLTSPDTQSGGGGEDESGAAVASPMPPPTQALPSTQVAPPPTQIAPPNATEEPVPSVG